MIKDIWTVGPWKDDWFWVQLPTSLQSIAKTVCLAIQMKISIQLKCVACHHTQHRATKRKRNALNHANQYSAPHNIRDLQKSLTPEEINYVSSQSTVWESFCTNFTLDSESPWANFKFAWNVSRTSYGTIIAGARCFQHGLCSCTQNYCRKLCFINIKQQQPRLVTRFFFLEPSNMSSIHVRFLLANLFMFGPNIP